MKTKHIFITLFAMLAAFLATSCTDKDSLTGTEAPGSTRTLSFNLTTDAQAQTRATTSSAPSVAGYKVQYILQVLDADGNDYGSQVTNETGTFEVELPVGVAYTCLFWAQYIPTTGGSGTSEYFTTDDLKAVALKDVLTAEDQCQAFCATADVTANQAAATNTVILKRAVAQVNLRSNEDLKYYDKIEATYSDVPNVFNVKDNTVSTSGTTGVPSTFSITETDISADGDSKFTFHSVYFLARGDGNANLLKIELNTYNEGDPTAIQTLTVPNVPTKKNYKTNVTATLDAASFTHNFTFDYAEWETTELAPEPFDPSVWNGTDGTTADPGYSFSGAGTKTDPYLIASASDLAQLASNVNAGDRYSGKYFELTTDINLNNHEWTPIGTEANDFQGVFDGDKHKIAGLKIDNNSLKHAGLFGYISGYYNSYTKDIHVTGNVQSNYTDGYTGGICGLGERVKGCSFAGSVSNPNGYAGGIGGKIGDATECCVNNGAITGKNAGGIVGTVDGPSDTGVYASYNTGKITASAEGGGIVGTTSAVVKACYNIGAIEGEGTLRSIGYACDEFRSCYVIRQYTNDSDGGTYAHEISVFTNGTWPTSTGKWTVDPSPDGSDNKYWKSLGAWSSDPNAIEYPKLWWEE